MIILFALLLLKYGYLSVYFVDLKAHEESQRSWLGKACWGCLFSLTDGDDRNSTFSVYKLQLEQLCDFVPSDRLFSFLSHLCLSPNFWWKERKAGTGDKPMKTSHFQGRWENQWPSLCTGSIAWLRCWQWQRHETLALLSLDVKSRRGKGSTPYSLTAGCSTRPRLQGHTDWAWGSQQCR